MYNLPYFKENDAEVVLGFMQNHPFITLCGADTKCNPVATHVPVLFDIRQDRIFLRGHIMRKTDHHLAFQQNPNVLAIFSGAHTYVSASWYSQPRQGSTWNYMAVHAHGKLQFLNGDELEKLLRDLTAHFENNENSPSLFEKLDRSYIDQMTKAIVAFEIEVMEIDNVFKLSQNRDKASFHNIIERLQKKDEQAKMIAAEMEQRTLQLFKGKSE
jgi:transcriptional regulator